MLKYLMGQGLLSSTLQPQARDYDRKSVTLSLAEHKLYHIIVGKKNVFYTQMYLQNRIHINKYFHARI